MILKTLDIVKFSDDFRQLGAKRTPYEADIVRFGLYFAARATFLRGEYPKSNWVNQEVIAGLRDVGGDIVALAKEGAFKKVVLPHEVRSNVGKWVATDVCKPLSEKFGLAVEGRLSRFYPNYAGAQPGIETCLDEGIRGVANVAPPWELKRAA